MAKVKPYSRLEQPPAPVGDWYASLFEHNPDAVFSFDTEGCFLSASPACQRVSGYTPEELVDTPWMRLIVPEALERARHHFRLAAKGAPQRYESAIFHRDGHRVDIGVTLVPIVVAGRVAGVFGITSDITERKRAEAERTQLAREQAARAEAERTQARFGFLAEVSALMSTSLDRDVTLRNIAQLMVPRLANWCLVGLVEADEQPRHLAVASAEPRHEALIRATLPRLLAPERQLVLQRVLRTRRPELVARIGAAELRAAVPDPEQLALLRKLGIASAMFVPLLSRDRTLGIITFVAGAGRRYGVEDLELAEEVARRCALALDNALLYRAAQQEITERKRAEVSLEQLGRQHELILTSVAEGIVGTDAERLINFVNPSAAQMLGYAADELLGRRGHELVHYARADGSSLSIDECLACEPLRTGQPRTSADGEVFCRKDGTNFPVEYVSAPISIGGQTRGLVLLFRDITRPLETRRQLTEQTRALALFEERQRIAMELHDRVIQALYGIGLGVDVQARTLGRAAEERVASLARTRAQVNAVIQEIRNYIFNLRPRQAAELGLRGGIELLAEELHVNTLSRAEVEIAPDAEGAPAPETVDQLLAITREATSNVIRHARASKVSIGVHLEEDWLLLTIQDDGVGFEPHERHARDGQGLRNMAERASRLGGGLEIDSRPAQGTLVRVRVPLRAVSARTA